MVGLFERSIKATVGTILGRCDGTFICPRGITAARTALTVDRSANQRYHDYMMDFFCGFFVVISTLFVTALETLLGWCPNMQKDEIFLNIILKCFFYFTSNWIQIDKIRFFRRADCIHLHTGKVCNPQVCFTFSFSSFF